MSRTLIKTDYNIYLLTNLVINFFDEDHQIAFLFIAKQENNHPNLIQNKKLDILNILARLTDLTIVKEAINKGYSFNSKEDFYENLALGNSLKSLKYFHKTPTEFFESTCYAVALSGNLCILQWIKDKYKIKHTNSRYIYSSEIAKAAIVGGHLHIIIWLKKNKGQINNEVITFAAKKGNYEIFTFLFPKIKKVNTDIMKSALVGGNIDIVKYLQDKNHLLEDNCINYAAESCSFELLKYLFELNFDLHYVIYLHAAQKNRMDIMNWAYENSCPLDHSVMFAAAAYGNVEILKWCHVRNCPIPPQTNNWINIAASNGHQNVIEWVLEKNIPFDKKFICLFATKTKNIKFIKWLREKGFNFTYGMLKVAWDTNFQFFRELCAIGCPFDNEILYELVIKGGISILKVLFEAGVKPASNICTLAAMRGQYEILKLAHKHGCICDIQVCFYAAKRGDLKMLAWAINKRIPIDITISKIAIENDQKHIVKFLIDNGFECTKECIDMYRRYYGPPELL
jgi:hypothetical protein